MSQHLEVQPPETLEDQLGHTAVITLPTVTAEMIEEAVAEALGGVK